jgi:hypothetical protein
MDPDQYIEVVSALNRQNAENSTTLPFERRRPKRQFKSFWNPNSSTLRNLAKAFTLIALVFMAAHFTYMSMYAGTSPYAMAQNEFLGFGETPVEEAASGPVANRADPSFAQDVTLINRGVSKTFNTAAPSVRDVLSAENVTINYGDGVFPELDAPVGDNETIVVDKITTKSVSEEEVVAHGEQRIDDNGIKKGEEQVTEDGQDGKTMNTYIIHEVSGFVVAKKFFTGATTQELKDRVVHVGTLELADNSGGMAVPHASVGEDTAKQFALEQIRAQGWPDTEFDCLDPLWQRESGWRVQAGNMFSGAYGIPQALPGSKMSSAGPDWETNANTQIIWGIGYIKGRYGTPCNAWANWNAKHWY